MPGKSGIFKKDNAWAGGASSEAEGEREGFGAPLAFRTPSSLSFTFLDCFPHMENPPVSVGEIPFRGCLSSCDCSRTGWEMCPEGPGEVIHSSAWPFSLCDP